MNLAAFTGSPGHLNFGTLNSWHFTHLQHKAKSWSDSVYIRFHQKYFSGEASDPKKKATCLDYKTRWVHICNWSKIIMILDNSNDKITIIFAGTAVEARRCIDQRGSTNSRCWCPLDALLDQYLPTWIRFWNLKPKKNIARGSTDPGYWFFSLSYLSS